MLSKLSTEEKKARFLEYFAKLPIQKLACGFAGINQDTATDWKKSDPAFSDQLELLKSEWAENNTSKIRNKEWLLERVMKDHFAQRSELTGADGKDLPIPILGGVKQDVSTDNSNKEDPTTK
jgi:hypothetical protein